MDVTTEKVAKKANSHLSRPSWQKNNQAEYYYSTFLDRMLVNRMNYASGIVLAITHLKGQSHQILVSL